MAYPKTVKIDKDVPRPPKSKYQVKDMQVGDSFFAQGRTQRLMGGFRDYYKRKFGFRFEIHTVVENGRRGCRVWRRK